MTAYQKARPHSMRCAALPRCPSWSGIGNISSRSAATGRPAGRASMQPFYLAAEAALCAGLGGRRPVLRALGLRVLLALQRGDPRAARWVRRIRAAAVLAALSAACGDADRGGGCCRCSIFARIGTVLHLPGQRLAAFRRSIWSWCRTGGRTSPQSFDGPTWSVSIEVLLYVLFFAALPRWVCDAGWPSLLAGARRGVPLLWFDEHIAAA